jgi:hypothetical protein
MDRVFSEDATAEGQEVKKALSGERRGEEVQQRIKKVVDCYIVSLVFRWKVDENKLCR